MQFSVDKDTGPLPKIVVTECNVISGEFAIRAIAIESSTPGSVSRISL